MLGAVIKPGRIYVSNRIRGHFISKMINFNRIGANHTKRVAMLERVRASINSYLGLMCHFNTYKLRRRICEEYILPVWGKYLYFENEFQKCVLSKDFNETFLLRKRLKNHRYAAKFIRPRW